MLVNSEVIKSAKLQDKFFYSALFHSLSRKGYKVPQEAIEFANKTMKGPQIIDKADAQMQGPALKFLRIQSNIHIYWSVGGEHASLSYGGCAVSRELNDLSEILRDCLREFEHRVINFENNGDLGLYYPFELYGLLSDNSLFNIDNCYVTSQDEIELSVNCREIILFDFFLDDIVGYIMGSFNLELAKRYQYCNPYFFDPFFFDFYYFYTFFPNHDCVYQLENSRGHYGGGNGGDGDKGEETDHTTPTESSSLSPCQAANRMNNCLTQEQKERLNFHKEQAETMQEHATLFFDDYQTMTYKGPVKTRGNNGTVALPTSTSLNGRTLNMIVHNHTKPLSYYDDGDLAVEYTSTCFSATDIGYLHDLINDATAKLADNFAFVVIHEKATYILNINDMKKFKNSDASSNEKDLKEWQKLMMQEQVQECIHKGIHAKSINIDKISRETFMRIYHNYGINLIRSSNEDGQDWTANDNWHNITWENQNPKNKNLINPCK